MRRCLSKPKRRRHLSLRKRLDTLVPRLHGLRHLHEQRRVKNARRHRHDAVVGFRKLPRQRQHGGVPYNLSSSGPGRVGPCTFGPASYFDAGTSTPSIISYFLKCSCSALWFSFHLLWNYSRVPCCVFLNGVCEYGCGPLSSWSPALREGLGLRLFAICWGSWGSLMAGWSRLILSGAILRCCWLLTRRGWRWSWGL